MAAFIPLVTIFWIVYFSSSTLFWLHWLALAAACHLYQTRRHVHFIKDFLVPCWITFLFVNAVCFSWVWLHETAIYFFCLIIFSLFFPLLFTFHHLLTSKIRSPTVETATMFGIFFVLATLLSLIPSLGSIGLDHFFQPPASALCVLKFITFKVWSAWVFTALFALSFWSQKRKFRCLALPAALAGALAALVILAQTQKVPFGTDSTNQTVKIALIQANLPYTEDWRHGHALRVKNKFTELALKAALDAPDLIIFPLYDLPGDVYREPEFLQDLARKANRPILVATDVPVKAGDEEFDQGYMRLALLYGPDGTLKAVYKAVEAAPLTYQYVEKASDYRVIEGPFGKLGMLLCFEDTIPRLSHQAARDGAKVLVALSNPGLFQKTPLLAHHLFQDQIRAAETGLPLVRVSSNGYSALIDSTGTILQKTKLNTEEILQVLIPIRKDEGDSKS